MGSKRNADNPSGGRYPDSKERIDIQKTTVQSPSFKTLINWNISKVVKNKPGIDLKAALKEAQERLEEAHDVKELMSADARNLCCALLAWQQLGHSSTDSLFNFVQQSLKEEECELKQNEESLSTSSSYESGHPECPVISTQRVSGLKISSQWGSPYKMDFSTSIGLVVKLPAEPQTLMRISGPIRVPFKNNTNTLSSRGKPGNDIAKKIDNEVKLCWVDTSCLERLASIEVETKGLRKRVSLFANREKQRNEMLERAEMAWRDLDAGYQRRLLLAKEKEEDYKNEMRNILNERNRYKEACVPLANTLKVKSEAMHNEEEALTRLEQEVCAKACARAQLAERSAQADTHLMENQCKASQLDRNLALKEEQQRHKKAALQGEMEAAQMVTHEAEYAQRSELQAQSEQVAQVSQNLLEEDARTALLKKRVEDYMVEKNEIIEDLEACQTKCDGQMAALVNDLKSKRDQLAELEDKVMKCECKEPVERAVQVKRTPSLAAMCKCSPSEVGSCSCTSIRSRLLSSLLSNLFGGLKSEMEPIGSQMPCHLLKCLEDSHNWDRTTDVKQNIRAYFSRLLLGELDIAIATVIEKSHARWVGESCVDRRKPQLLEESKDSLRWQERELEMRTQKLANELAEKMFREKAQELAMQAQEELEKSGHLPCECDHNNNEQYAAAVYSCLVHPYPDCHLNRIKNDQLTDPYKVRWKKNITPPLVSTRLLKKDADGSEAALLSNYRTTTKVRRKDVKRIRPESILRNSSNVYNNAKTQRISNFNAKNPKTDTNKLNPEFKTGKKKIGMYSSNKVFKGPQQYAVNMCLCDHKNDLPFKKSHNNFHIESTLPYSYKSCDLCLRQQKSMLSDVLENNSFLERDKTGIDSNTKKCTCLNKPPSNTSIDRLVSVLNKWKNNLGQSQASNIKEAVNTDSLFKITHTSILNVLKELREQTDETDTKINILRQEKCAKSVENTPHKNKKEIDNKAELSNGIPSELQINQSTLLLPLNNVLYNCIANVENSTSTANNQPIMPLSVKADLQPGTTKNNLPPKSKITQDKYSEINRSIKDSHLEIDFTEKTPDINIIQFDPHLQGGEKYIQCLGATLANVACKRSLTKTANQQDHIDKKTQYNNQINNNINLYENENKSINNCNFSNDQKTFKQVVENPPVNTDNNCESYIQFLGVALYKANANVLEKRKTKKQSQSNNKKNHQDHVFQNKRNNNNGKSDNKMFKFYTRYLSKPKCAIKLNKNTLDVVHVHNECVYPHMNVEKSNDIKSMQVQTNSNDFLSQETCVCCRKSKDDISNDLEVNAFQLLEEHLRSKLDEIKHSICKSSCIQNVDEKSILGDTLLKVKKLILESANTVTCRCAQCTHTSEGSWKRAYGLLQEYLKSKIDNVKCLCNSVEYSRHENLVSQVLSQVSCLIENDLQRLKDMCKSNDTALDTNNYESYSTPEMQCIAGKPGNSNHTIISNATNPNYNSTSKILESKFDSYTSGDFLPHNKSAQVLIRHLVESKSCNALKTYNKYFEVQTDTENYNSTYYVDVRNESTKKIEPEVNLLPKLQSCGFFKDAPPFQAKDITVLPVVLSPNDNINENNSKKILSFVDVQLADEKIVADSVKGDEKIEKPFMAYIGCTLNCCCDHDLGCVCTKSTLLSNTDRLKTNFIWNIFTQKQALTKNVTYIQNSITNKAPDTADSVLHVKEGSQLKETIQSNNRRESNIRPNVEKNIYLNRHKLKLHLDDNYNKEDLLVVSKTKLCVSEVNASDEKLVYLKKSDQRLGITHGAMSTNTLTDDYSIQGISILPKIMPFINSDTALMTNHAFQRLTPFSKNCDCAMVPICHAKMLVENIANKLLKVECTCDSLKGVCPIHS